MSLSSKYDFEKTKMDLAKLRDLWTFSAILAPWESQITLGGGHPQMQRRCFPFSLFSPKWFLWGGVGMGKRRDARRNNWSTTKLSDQSKFVDFQHQSWGGVKWPSCIGVVLLGEWEHPKEMNIAWQNGSEGMNFFGHPSNVASLTLLSGQCWFPSTTCSVHVSSMFVLFLSEGQVFLDWLTWGHTEEIRMAKFI